MGQLGAVPNVEFHAVGFPADFGERLKTKAGGNIFITLKDAIAMSGSHPPNLTGQWKVFCPRLVGATELELVLAVPQPGSPKTIKITGKYESLPSDSGKTISVNMDVPVRY